jgi:hypothetical protein
LVKLNHLSFSNQYCSQVITGFPWLLVMCLSLKLGTEIYDCEGREVVLTKVVKSSLNYRNSPK